MNAIDSKQPFNITNTRIQTTQLDIALEVGYLNFSPP
jgi:hypothetical protein